MWNEQEGVALREGKGGIGGKESDTSGAMKRQRILESRRSDARMRKRNRVCKERWRGGEKR